MSLKQPKYRIIISGGGTGGHIFPAIAIANALKRLDENTDILFIGATGKMEMEKVPAAGYPIQGLPIVGIQRRLTLKNLEFPFKLISSLKKASSIIKSFAPDAVVGVGGYASGPTLFMATRKKIPVLIQEQNSFPGITNKILAKKADRICVAYDGMESFFEASKIIHTGNPIRQNVIEIKGKRNEAATFFNLKAGKKTVFVVGGSQGARSINRAISGFLNYFGEEDIQLLWQTGTGFLAEANELTQGNTHITAVDFIHRMDLAYAMADVVISRAGAIAISELCAVQKPTIFIPLPSAAEDHQMKNALALTEKNAAIVVKDADAGAMLFEVLSALILDEQKQKELTGNMKPLAITDADDRIAREIIKLIKANNG